MQDIEQLPLEQWASQLKAARQAAGIDFSTLAQELLLSQAQLRCLETGSLTAFHGPGYYLRAVEKYAQRLDIVLDPPVTELTLSDSQLALKRVKNTPSASSIAKKHTNRLDSEVLPSASSRTRVGVWLGVLLIALVGVGTWMAISEGWPNGENGNGTALVEQTAVQTDASSPIEPEQQNEDTLAAASANASANASVTTPEQATSDLFGSPLATDPTANATDPTTAAVTDPASETANSTNPQTTPAAQAAPDPEPDSTPEPPPAPPPPPPDVIQASFNADCWVEIRRVDGTTEQGIYKPGQSVTVDVADIERLTFGNAAAVSATRAGEPFDVLAYTRGGNNVARISKQALN